MVPRGRYELDGNNDGPIELGPLESPEGFLSAAAAHVKEAYIQPFPESNFVMMALGPAAGKGGSS